jgi:hypothetical protein
MQRWFALIMLLVAELPAAAQYPGGRAPQVPLGIPRAGKQKKAPEEATLNISGVLRRLSDKVLILEAQDTRILTLTRTQKTTFYNESGEAKPSELQPGDQLFVEARQDDAGFLYAVTVTRQKVGTPEERARASEPVQPSLQRSPGDEAPPPLRRADSPRKDPDADETDAAAPEPERAATREVGPPARLGADDPGPPVLRRGIPAKRREQESEDEDADAGAAPAEPAKADPIIEKARLAAETFEEKLPNYVCRQMTTRYQSSSRPANWKPIDVLSADVVYEDGKEQYRNLAVNGKTTRKKMEELGGSWSKGEYGSILGDLFSPSTGADFRLRKSEQMAGADAAVYDFSVELPNSHWSIHVPSQVFKPAYSGSVWIDRKNGRVLRIEMQARRLPEEFPLDTVEASVDYQYVRLGGAQEYLLPVHAEMLSCERGSSNCSRNAMDFRNYHKYEGESTIKYEQQ